MENIPRLIVVLINSMAVISVVGYILTRSRFYNDILEKRMTWKIRLFLILLFGGLSIYGTLSGFELMGAIANTRDLGPALAGLIAGPAVGLGAGLIGAVHRYSLGGFTCVSCSLATLAAGLVGGLVYQWRKGRFIGVTGAAVVAGVNQIIHSGLALLIARPFEQALKVVVDFTVPMVAANAVGMAIYASIIVNLAKQRNWEKEKDTIEGELNAAREIQMSMVPKMFPAFPDRPEFQLYAALEPAKEVGGDLYDFFFTDNDHLVFLVGDVSGKGVPASLFMAVTKTLLKSKATADAGPDRIFQSVNDELAKGNDMSMFATVFCGILDTKTGKVDYSSAGHNPPVILERDGEPRYLPLDGTLALGAFEGSAYHRGTLTLAPGDNLILYTDGVTEAMNQKSDFFSDEGLLHSLRGTGGQSPEDMLKKILSDVHAFAAGAPPSDDITLLVLKYNGRSHEDKS